MRVLGLALFAFALACATEPQEEEVGTTSQAVTGGPQPMFVMQDPPLPGSEPVPESVGSPLPDPPADPAYVAKQQAYLKAVRARAHAKGSLDVSHDDEHELKRQHLGE